MLPTKRVLARLAAGATATVFMTVGGLAPAYAASDGAQQNGQDHSQGNASTTGAYDEPQPESNADQNSGGANAGECTATSTHSYCSTRDGSASENGVGDGQATGKPCAGCVGKADNKFPPGQYPDGSDHNAGYECDRNQGIGKTNPAHTGCVPEEQPKPEKPVEKPPVVVPEEQPKPEKPVEKPPVVVPEEKPKPEKPVEKPPVVVPEEKPKPEVVPPVAPAPPAPPAVAPPVAPVPPEAAPVEQERPAPVVNRAPAPVAPAAVAPAAGVLPAAGAGEYGLLALAGSVLLAAGIVLSTRRRTQTGS